MLQILLSIALSFTADVQALRHLALRSLNLPRFFVTENIVPRSKCSKTMALRVTSFTSGLFHCH